MHSIYERFYTGKLDFFDVCMEYEEQYAVKVNLKFPPNCFVDLNKKYYQTGLSVLERFDDIPDNIEILDVECTIQTEISGYRFIGYADLILRKRDTGEIIIVDHKSKSKFTSKTEQKHYARQLYLYAVYVLEKYGKYPDKLVFNMFRADKIIEIPFDKNDFNEAIQWFVHTIEDIYVDFEFLDKIEIEYSRRNKEIETFSKQDFFCNELCGVRAYCPRSTREKKKHAHRKKDN